ncbi:MAG: DMT family transporter [Bacteroidales bacterium]|nr:DMT family transporter [Bacteroidales bacterium]
MARTKFFYHLLALAVVAVWGVTFVCTKELIRAGLMPAQIFAIRFTLAYLGILALSLVQGRGRMRLWSRDWKDELLFVFLGITGGSFYFLTENTALAYTQASNVAFLVCSAPLITALLSLAYSRLRKDRFSAALEDVRLDFPLVGGTVLAMGGMALMLFDGTRLQVSLRGDLLAVGAAVCWALYSLFMGKMTEEYGAVFATRKVFIYGLLTIIPFLVGRGGFPLEALQRPAVILNLLFLALIASLACFVVWNLVMSKLGNITSTNYVYLNPVFTLITAMIFLGERMTLAGAVGSALILGGVILAGQHGRRPRRS